MARRNIQAALRRFEHDWGIEFPGACDYMPEEFRTDYAMALDAQPGLVTAPNAGIPVFLTQFIDPDILRIRTAPNNAAKILGEKRKGDFKDTTAIFPVVEHTGTVTSYGDFNEGATVGANTNWENREQYLYEAIASWGILELERAGAARIGWAAELKMSQVERMGKFENLTYFRGVAGLANYGMLNAPGLPAPMAPAPKANGGVSWFVGNSPNATGQEVYNDILSMVTSLTVTSGGQINAQDKMVLALSPKSANALNFTNIYNVNTTKQLNDNYPNLRVETAVQYGAYSAQNPEGSVAGEIVQLFAVNAGGQETGFCAFGEKLRAFPIIVQISSYKQKMAGGTWGAIVRQPFAVAQLYGV